MKMNYQLGKQLLLVAGSIIFIQFSYKTADKFPFRDPSLSFENRVNDLVSRLTLREKIDQMRNSAPAIPRLGIPRYNWWNECLHGIGRSDYNVTVFPQAIGMAATFNDAALTQMASITSDEARAIYYESNRTGKEGAQYSGLTFWTPNINIFRDPRWGRGQETYGEDPYLTSRMGMAMVRGLQGNDPKYLKTSACAKHYAVHSGPEAQRHTFDVTASDYDLWDTYLPAFEKLVVDAKVSSVMCAYNRYAGQPCCGSDLLLTDILRNKWGFTGYVTSDCGAVEDFFRSHKTHPDAESATADAVLHGTDLECGGSYGALMEAVKDKKITEAQIDVSVKRLFMIRFRLGMFDPPGMVPYSKIPMSVVENRAHHDHSLKMARESIVLLKNDQHTLPLNKNIRKIAVVGPNADDKNALLGNYNGFPSKIVTVLEGIKSKLGAGTQVIYEKGLNYNNELLFEKLDLSQNFTYKGAGTWQAEYFNDQHLEGKPAYTALVKHIDLAPSKNDVLPQGVSANNFSARYTTLFTSEKAAAYTLQFSSARGYRLFVDGKKTLDQWNDHENLSSQYTLKMEAGKQYSVVVEYHQQGGKPSLMLTTGRMIKGSKEALVSKVSDADVIVFAGGISNAFEAEGADKKSIDLPSIQTEYLKALKATGKPIVFVMFTGSAMSIGWEAENLPTIVNGWYAGQDAGTAIADVIFGDYNPAGRLPVTFYKSVNDLPALEDYSMTNRTYRYFKGQPLFSFGYGLSYTSFNYKWSVQPRHYYSPNDTIAFSVEIKNTGKMTGDEVAQVYVQYPGGGIFPLKELRQFKRVAIGAGMSQKVSFKIPVIELRKWDEIKHDRKVPAGKYRIFVGGNADVQNLAVEFEIK
ncbi:MAG: glycoside hydrolase family 3 [Ferruginibacter sp.]|nr:glycoside hydrolase family 3 [Ferruginibacter sp.]